MRDETQKGTAMTPDRLAAAVRAMCDRPNGPGEGWGPCCYPQCDCPPDDPDIVGAMAVLTALGAFDTPAAPKSAECVQ